VSAPHGASLFWFDERGTRRALVELALDRQGHALRPPQRRFEVSQDGPISDLAAAWVGQELHLAWLFGHGDRADVWHYDSTGSKVEPLVEAWPAPADARGNLSLTARPSHALLMTRGPDHACSVDETQRCFGFDFHRLAGGNARSSGVPLDVPVPCQRGAAHTLSLGSRWHYAVCTEVSGQSVTTVFNITPEPEYAEAFSVLDGCEPLGLTHWSGRPWLIANCGDEKRAAELVPDGEVRSLESARLTCRANHPVLEAGSLRLPLEEPRDRTELLLESSPDEARSMWTGQVHLRATFADASPRLIRQTCAGDRLETRTLPIEIAPPRD
jgi:hypothetical protein